MTACLCEESCSVVSTSILKGLSQDGKQLHCLNKRSKFLWVAGPLIPAQEATKEPDNVVDLRDFFILFQHRRVKQNILSMHIFRNNAGCLRAAPSRFASGAAVCKWVCGAWQTVSQAGLCARRGSGFSSRLTWFPAITRQPRTEAPSQSGFQFRSSLQKQARQACPPRTTQTLSRR